MTGHNSSHAGQGSFLPIALGFLVLVGQANLANGAKADVRGYCGDGTGRYPTATPVTAWNLADGTNIRWFTPLIWSKASPVVWKDRVFVCEEPHFLVCLNRTDGSLLWRREANVFELIKPDRLAESRELDRRSREQWAKRTALGRWRDERLAKLIQDGLSPAEAAGRLQDLFEAEHAAHKELVRLLHKEGIADWPICYGSAPLCGPWTGYSFATPVTDGKHVWVKFASGVVACYTLDGEQRWLVATPYQMAAGSECSSPLLSDGVVILQMAYRQEVGKWMRYDRVYLLALDAATGEERWRTDARDFRPNTTPVIVSLPDGDETVNVVVTGSGTVVRASDGKILGKLPGNDDGYGGLTVVKNVVYRSGAAKGCAVEMTLTDPATVEGKLLWQINSEGCPGGWVYHAGVVSGLTGQTSGRGLAMFDAQTGEVIGRRVNRNVKNVGALRWAAVWIPPIVAGQHVYYSDRGTSGWKHPFEHAGVTVMQTGRAGRIVAHNQLPRTTDSPLVADGDELFARVDDGLFCLGRTGEKGARYEALENARLIMEDIAPTPPPARPVREIASAAKADDDIGIPLVAGYHQFFKRPIFGPITTNNPVAIRQMLLTNSLEEVTGNEQTATKLPRWEQRRDMDLLVFDRGHETLDAGRFGVPPGAVLYTGETLRVATSQVVRVSELRPHLRCWISGVEVADQDRLLLGSGRHDVWLEIRVPEQSSGSLPIQVRFEPSPDPVAEASFWRASVAQNRVLLERVIQLAPASSVAAPAQRLLDQLN